MGLDETPLQGTLEARLKEAVLANQNGKEAPQSFEQTPSLPTHSEDGVDLSLIRWMLTLSLAERLRAAQQYAQSVHRFRRARTNS